MELYKDIEVMDVLVLLAGGILSFSVLLSDLPFHFIIFGILMMFTVSIVIPIDGEKAYWSLFHAVRYAARYKCFGQVKKDEKEIPAGKKRKKKTEKQNPGVRAITPFTGINGGFIEYGNSYSGAVVEIPSVEFRFFSESRQNSMIDRVFGGILRGIGIDETASLVKIDRPVIYDEYIRCEEQKKADLKEAYLNGLLTDEELTCRIGIVEDRIAMIRRFNDQDKVFLPFYYLVFYGKDRERLKEHVDETMNRFASNDMNCRHLTGADLAVFLKYNYTIAFDEREVKKLRPEEYMDWILPKMIRFTPRTVKYDNLITHNLRVIGYPTLVANAWGHTIFNMPGTRVTMMLKPVEHYKAVRQVDRAFGELQEQAERTSKASKQMELDTHIQTLGEVLRLLQGDNELLFSTDIYVTSYDYEFSREMMEYTGKKGEKKPVSKEKKAIRRKMAEEGFKTSDMFMQQFEAYTSSLISANDAMRNDSVSIHSSSVAAVFPFVYKHIMDKRGVYIGNSGGVPAFVNFFQRDKDRVNSNMVIIGKSGSGKSYATKTILTHLAAENSKIFILDPENEYQKMAENFNGKIIDVGSATQGRLNPFHIITNLEDDDEETTEEENVKKAAESDSFDDGFGDSFGDDGFGSANNSLNVHLQFLEEFYRQILPGIDSDALEYLNNITSRMYEEKGIDQNTDLSALTPADYPTFDDLFEKILNDFQTATGEYSKNNLRILLNYISKFATGGRNSSLWNGEATLSTKENFIVFNFQSLLANKNNTIANAQMLLILKWLDNEIIKNRDYNLKHNSNRKIIVVIDEAHVFIDSKYPIALDFMFQLAKRIRKYNGMQIVITQNIKDFVGTEELARKSTAIINASQYSFIFPLAPNDMHDLCKLYEKAGAINESEQEDIINNGRGRAFLITSPSERTCVDIVAGQDIERLFTM